MLKLFLDWIDLKFKITSSIKNPRPFKEAEVWWCAVGQNIGSETFGKSEFFSRPVLVFRKLSNNLFFGIPLTSKTKSGTWFVNITLNGKVRSTLLHQARALDEKRLYSKISELNNEDFQNVKKGFNKLINHKINFPPISRRHRDNPKIDNILKYFLLFVKGLSTEFEQKIIIRETVAFHLKNLIVQIQKLF